MQAIQTFLWFNGGAEEAVDFWVSAPLQCIRIGAADEPQLCRTRVYARCHPLPPPGAGGWLVSIFESVA
jgi:hypothetical protein